MQNTEQPKTEQLPTGVIVPEPRPLDYTWRPFKLDISGAVEIKIPEPTIHHKVSLGIPAETQPVILAIAVILAAAYFFGKKVK
jgi:hypothetical protein